MAVGGDVTRDVVKSPVRGARPGGQRGRVHAEHPGATRARRVSWRSRGRDAAPESPGRGARTLFSAVASPSVQILVHLREERRVWTAAREREPDRAHRHANPRADLEQGQANVVH